MSLIDKAKEISGQAVGKVGETVGDLGGDDLIVNTIIRTAEKQERMNRLLERRAAITASLESKSKTAYPQS